MYTGDPFCHSSTCEVMVPAMQAFNYMSDGVAQGDWTLGSMERRKLEEHLYTGKSIFNHAQLYIRIDADPERLVILYHVGRDKAALEPRNFVRIVPGPVIGAAEDSCLVTLLSWRHKTADDDQWKLTCVSHETEMYIIKNRLEQGAGA